jgi:ParB/RepB/Spo0J family partition protein
MDIELGKLRVSPFNVRRDIGDISELVESVKAQGVLEPIVVRPAGDQYEVIIGARRLAAAKEAGLHTIPAEVREMTDAQALAQSLVENLHRGDLELEERVKAYEMLQTVAPDTCGTLYGLAKAIGRPHQAVSRDFEAYRALTILRPHGIQIARSVQSEAAVRQRGEALPEYHATLLEQAVSAVKADLPSDKVEQKYVELAKAIAPLERDNAKRLLDEFKKYPEKPVSEIRARALSQVELPLTLDRLTARKLDELAETTGKKSVAEVISDLVERAAPPEPRKPREEMPVTEGTIYTIGRIECDKCGKSYTIKCDGKRNWLE